MKRLMSIFMAVAILFTMCNMFTLAAEENAMAFSTDAINILKKIEGFSPRPYWDVTQWTVGYGTYCSDELYEKFKADPNKVITEQEALALLDQQLSNFVNAVNAFAVKHSLTLAQHQFDALVMFSYNCGTSWTTETTGTFYNAVKNQLTGSEFIYAICLWSSAGGQFILTKRRMSEANMYLNGVYEAYNDSSDGTYPSTFKYVLMDGNGGKVNYTMHGYDAADKSSILTKVTAPTGVDKSGKTFSYTLDGWYTASTGGTKVEILDGSLADGTVLYARWKDPEGNITEIPRGEPASIQTTTTYDLEVRTGPGIESPVIDTVVAAGQSFKITEIIKMDDLYWGKCESGWVSLGSIWPKRGTLTADDVNVRSGPGTSNPKQYQLSKGATVFISELAFANNLCWGRLSDGNWICLDYVHIVLSASNTPLGDISADGQINKDDAILLLRHVVFPEDYPISANGDINQDGTVNKDDAIYLLRHVVFPEDYPLPF